MLSVKKKTVMNLEPHMAVVHQLVELGAAGPHLCRSEVWGGRSEILRSHLPPSHPTFYPAARNQHKGWFPLVLTPATEPLITVRYRTKHLRTSCANRAEQRSSVLSQSHPCTLTSLCLPSIPSQMCGTAVGRSTLSIISPKSWLTSTFKTLEHNLLFLTYCCYFYSDQFSDGI